MTATINLGSFIQQSVNAAGFDITYYEAGIGTPLVMLPGAGGPALSPSHEALAEQFRVIVIEYPGFGMQPNDVVDFDGLADQIVATIDAIGLTTFHLLGTSFGAACALHLAARHEDRVISLTLESPAKFRVDSVNPGELPPEKFVSAFRTHPNRGLAISPPDPEFMPRVWPMVERLMLDGAVEPAFVDRIAAIDTRTLVMFGRDDGIINPINGRTYRAAMPNCVLMYVYDAAHDICNDRPEMFVDVVSDFVRRGMNFLVNDTDRLINP